MAFLANRSVNMLNLHYGLHALAMSGGGVFYAVYLLKAGVSVPLVLTAFAAIFGGRFLLRPLILVLARRWGLKPVVIAGTLVQAVQYLILAHVHGLDVYLLALCLVSALGDTLYWTTYHAYFAALGDAEHRGQQVSAREALAAGVGIVAPVLGGWALVSLGAGVAFGLVALIQALAALPLLGGPDVRVADQAPGMLKASRMGFVLFLAEGWMGAGWVFVWQIVLFLNLNQSLTAFGGAMALAAIAGALGGLVLGRVVDAGHGGRAAALAFTVLAATIVLRTLASHPVLALAANALGSLVGCLYVPPLMTAVYNLAKASPCALRFHMVTEGAFDLGCGVCCLLTACLIHLGVPISQTLLLALLGATGTLLLLRRYYAETPMAETV